MRPSFCLAKTIDCSKIEPAYALSELDTDLYMAFNAKTDSGLVDRLSAALQAMRRDGELARLTAPMTAP
jgi:polar amino acid transport system substrate-binding protein